MTEAEIGRLALDMHRKRLVVEKWMAESTTLVYANQCPNWKDYEEAQAALHTALVAAVPR